MSRNSPSHRVPLALAASLLALAVAVPFASGFGGGGARGPAPDWIAADYNDHQNMQQQLGIKALRPGKSGQGSQTGPGFDEATANNWMPTMPDALKMKDGTKVPAAQWEKRRAEILEDFEREVYGRVPKNVPKVTWEVTSTTEGNMGGVPTITRNLTGKVDNSAFPKITVNITASITVPANATGPVPVFVGFGGGGGGGFGGGAAPAGGAPGGVRGGAPGAPAAAPATPPARGGPGAMGPTLDGDTLFFIAAPGGGAGGGGAPGAGGFGGGRAGGAGGAGGRAGGAGGPGAAGGRAGGPGGGGGGGGGYPQLAIAHGWGYGSINPGSIQADSGNNNLRQGIIGLTNKGEPRKPEDWGALRAWGWGVSKLIDCLEEHPEFKADPKKLTIEGVSRYGKAALVTQAFDPRVACALVGSSGEGGAKLHRHDYGEAVENLTANGEYHWMSGSFLKYGASDINGKSMDASHLPVDSHELIALCAPRPCFISYGSTQGTSGGDPPWVDTPGSFRAGILASQVYALLGKKGYGSEYLDDMKWVHAPLPPVTTLVGGDLAFRQHTGGHTDGPNLPTFFDWIGNYIKSPMPAPTPAAPAAQ